MHTWTKYPPEHTAFVVHKSGRISTFHNGREYGSFRNWEELLKRRKPFNQPGPIIVYRATWEGEPIQAETEQVA